MSCEPWHPLDGQRIEGGKSQNEAHDEESPQCPECGGSMEEQDDGSFYCDDCGYEE